MLFVICYFVTLHPGTVLIVNVYFFSTYKDTNQLLSYQLFPLIFHVLMRSPFIVLMAMRVLAA